MAYNWKYVRLHCPSCEFEHDFKRSCWKEFNDLYVGHYSTDDMRARADCKQQMIFGEGKYEEFTKLTMPDPDKVSKS